MNVKMVLEDVTRKSKIDLTRELKIPFLGVQNLIQGQNEATGIFGPGKIIKQRKSA